MKEIKNGTKCDSISLGRCDKATKFFVKIHTKYSYEQLTKAHRTETLVTKWCA